MAIPTPTTHDTVVKGASSYTTERKKGGSAPVNGATAFAAVTDVRGALQVCSEAVKADRAVTSSSIGRASSVLT